MIFFCRVSRPTLRPSVPHAVVLFSVCERRGADMEDEGELDLVEEKSSRSPPRR